MNKFTFTLTFIFLFTATSFAQKTCSCPEYEQLLPLKNDSLAAAQLIRSGNALCRAKGFEQLGKWMNSHYEPDSAEYFLQKAEQLFRQSGCSDTVLLTTYKHLAQAHYTRGDFDKAQEYTFKLLHCTELTGNILETAKCHTMIAQLFNQTGQADKGIAYTRKAAGMLPRITELNERKDLLFLVAKRYLWHYQDMKARSSLDSSEMFGLNYLDVGRQLNNRNAISKAFSHLQGIAYENNDLKKALQLLDSSFAYLDKEYYDDLRVNYFDKADILIQLKKYDEAQRMADSSLLYARLAGHVAYLAESFALKARVAKETGDYKTAYEYTEQARNITDSIKDISKTKAVAELEKKYNQAKNENTITALSKKKQLYLLLAIAGILAATAIAFFMRQQKLKHKKDILETEQRLNRARMNPHFFFNALAALQKFAVKENNPQAMASNLSKFSNIMRETLESTYKEYITIEQEMEFLDEYLEVQKIRFPQAFSYNISADKELEVDDLLIPAMIIQPFVENSIEHGFAGVDYAGHISIDFKKDNKDLLIRMSDNGKGLSTTAKEDNEHISRASQIIKDRIYLLNIKLKTKAGFSIDNDASGKGVIVKINLPLLYKSQTTS